MMKQDLLVNNSLQTDSLNIDENSTRFCLDSSSKKESTSEKIANFLEKRERNSEISNVFLNMQAQNLEREREILETLGIYLCYLQ